MENLLLQVSGLSVKLQNQVILDNISFNLEKGKTLAIVGPNGAGKTVLFRTLLNMVPYTGKIRWFRNVRIGYVPQKLSVRDVPLSVREFLSFKSSSNIENSLTLVGLNPDDILDRSLSVLSGGQLQRVLIAWAIVNEPDVLLFDEPTTGVDIDSEEAIYKMLKELKQKREITILLISHEAHIIKEYSDYMLALNKCMTFFGRSENIADLDVQKIIFGEPVCLHALRTGGNND
ncbi:metal ABC transporter ATP-binding protein [Candidatus Bathyarchaeota archaeon]|nr:metal ABC transporter ATP-binding protein [Candidatus Bathyarchaeota archaeon]